jgi:hypothetical protein
MAPGDVTVETQCIRSAQNQGGRKNGQMYSMAGDDECAPFQAFRQCASQGSQGYETRVNTLILWAATIIDPHG